MKIGDMYRVICGGCDNCQTGAKSLIKNLGNYGGVYLWNESFLDQKIEDEHWVIDTQRCDSLVVVLDDRSPVDLKVMCANGIVGWLAREDCGEKI